MLETLKGNEMLLIGGRYHQANESIYIQARKFYTDLRYIIPTSDEGKVCFVLLEDCRGEQTDLHVNSKSSDLLSIWMRCHRDFGNALKL